MSDSIETSEDMARPWAGTTAQAAAPNTVVREALEAAHAGLNWYRDRCPDAVDGSDDEADALIARALAALDCMAGQAEADGITSAERSTLVAVLDVVRFANLALDDSEEMEGDDGERCHSVRSDDFDNLDEALQLLADLPDEDPHYTLGPAGKAKWALKRLLNEWPLGQARPTLTTPSRAAIDVLAERVRQMRQEGWTPRHDDEHDDESLALAAAWYATPHFTRSALDVNDMSLWPASWADAWFKPGARRGELVKAGALILAEIERLDRAADAARHTSDEAPT